MTLQDDYDALLRSQRLYGTGPEQLKKSIDANYEKTEKIVRLEKDNKMMSEMLISIANNILDWRKEV